MASKAKEEKKVHDKLLKLLREHFSEDEDEIAEEEQEEMEEMKPMKRNMALRRSYDFGGYDEDDDEMEDEYAEGFEEDEDEDEDEGYGKPSKDQRKQMAVVLVTKKAGRK